MILSFFKREDKQMQKESIPLIVDLHSHLIPAIDDGSQSMEESITLLRGLQDLGYAKLITTPHIMADTYRNNRKIIMSGLEKLHAEAQQRGLTIVIEAAAEYYLDDGFIALLDEGNMLTIGDNYLLFETSYVAKPIQIEEMIFAISSAGYKPLLAHPERYRYIKDPQREYSKLKEWGVMFQVNLNSFGGHYGKSAKENAEFLSQQGMIDFLGSDTHHIKQVESLANVLTSQEYRDIYLHNTILNNALR